jgi:hypothetical protein
VFIVVGVYFVITQSGNFWIYHVHPTVEQDGVVVELYRLVTDKHLSRVTGYSDEVFRSFPQSLQSRRDRILKMAKDVSFHTVIRFPVVITIRHQMLYNISVGLASLADYKIHESRDSSVGIALSYGPEDRGSRARFPVGAGNFYLHHRVQNGSGAHPASYPMDTGGSFPMGKAAGA